MAEIFDGKSSDSNAHVTADCLGPILRVTLEKPPANVLSLSVIESLQEELERARGDNAIRVVVLAARGKVYSAGHDLKELASHRSDVDGGRAFFERTFELCARLMQSIVTLPKPVIAEVDGIATAAGCQLVASCDLALASERSSFGVNGIDVGLFCTTPAVALTRVINRKRAMEMLLTGGMIDARTAEQFGLVNRVVASASLTQSVNELALRISEKSPFAVRLGKEGVEAQSGISLAQAYERASQVMVANMMGGDAKEGIEAFLEHRQPHWRTE